MSKQNFTEAVKVMNFACQREGFEDEMYNHFVKDIIPGFCDEIIRKLAKMPEDDRYIEKFA